MPQVSLDHQVLLDPRDNLEQQVQQELQVLLVLKVIQASMAFQEHLVKKVS